MQVLQAQATNPVLLRAEASHTDKSSESFLAGRTLRTVLACWVAIFDRHVHAEAAIAERFACKRWCDSTERELNNELMHKRFMHR